jgi:putative endonuclease
MQKGGAVYLITNKENRVLYIGVTSNLIVRIWEHKNKIHSNSFSAKYNCNKLVYYQFFFNIDEAIIEEKRLKAGNRQNKIDLINEFNPEWKDLFDDLV